MKKSLLFLGMIGLIFVFISCNKDKRANKLIDTTWYANELDGGSISSADSVIIRFVKTGKTNGTATIDMRYNSLEIYQQYDANYSIDDEKITLTTTAAGVEPSTTYEIIKLTKYELEWKNENGAISKFENRHK